MMPHNSGIRKIGIYPTLITLFGFLKKCDLKLDIQAKSPPNRACHGRKKPSSAIYQCSITVGNTSIFRKYFSTYNHKLLLCALDPHFNPKIPEKDFCEACEQSTKVSGQSIIFKGNLPKKCPL